MKEGGSEVWVGGGTADSPDLIFYLRLTWLALSSPGSLLLLGALSLPVLAALMTPAVIYIMATLKFLSWILNWNCDTVITWISTSGFFLGMANHLGWERKANGTLLKKLLVRGVLYAPEKTGWNPKCLHINSLPFLHYPYSAIFFPHGEYGKPELSRNDGTEEIRVLPDLSMSKCCVFPQEKCLQEDYMPKEVFFFKVWWQSWGFVLKRLGEIIQVEEEVKSLREKY